MKALNLTPASPVPTIAGRLPAWLLRLEGAAVLLAAVLIYDHMEFSWLTFLLALLLPDAAMAAYAISNHAGSLAYNAVHTLVLPLALILAAWLWSWPAAAPIGLIWAAHIGLDRFFGYGLKYPDHFKSTHFSRL